MAAVFDTGEDPFRIAVAIACGSMLGSDSRSRPTLHVITDCRMPARALFEGVPCSRAVVISAGSPAWAESCADPAISSDLDEWTLHPANDAFRVNLSGDA